MNEVGRKKLAGMHQTTAGITHIGICTEIATSLTETHSS
jgi:hypothetical protein